MEKKDSKANPYLPTTETIIPEQDCQIPFISLYPCGRPRKETAVLLCNWGLSITGFMHDFSGLRTVSSTCPAVLRPRTAWILQDAFALICLQFFYGASCVENMTGMQCVRCIMISYMSVFSVLRRSRAGNLHVALAI